MLTIIWLAVLGVCAGSFASALTWRIKNHKDWVRGRSQCPKCGHQLAARDLIPLLSWLSQRGRCRYCRKKISPIYPLSELIMVANFTISYYFWPGGLSSASSKYLLAGWLIISIALFSLALYDLRWQLLPNKILYPAALIAITYRFIYILTYSTDKSGELLQWLGAVAVASGIFWVIYQVSSGKWIGFGDVRLGLITGSVLGSVSKAVFMIFLASLLGVIVASPSVLINKEHLRKKVAYGPYLILATAISLLFGGSIINWYEGFWR